MVSPIFRHTNVDICWLYITWYSHSYPIESPCFMLNYGYITKWHILIDVECRLEVRISLLAKAWSKRCSAKRPPVALRPICRVRWTRGRGCPRGCPRYAAWAPGGRQLRKFNRGTGEPLIHWSSFMIFGCFCLSGTYLFHHLWPSLAIVKSLPGFLCGEFMCLVTAHFRFALQFAQHSLADWCLKTVDEFHYVPVVSAQHLLVRFFTVLKSLHSYWLPPPLPFMSFPAFDGWRNRHGPGKSLLWCGNLANSIEITACSA